MGGLAHRVPRPSGSRRLACPTHLAHEPCPSRLPGLRSPSRTRAPGNMQARGAASWPLDWLAGFPGGTWQQRWHASGAEHAGGRVEAGLRLLDDARGQFTPATGMDELSIGLILAVCADIVRPGLPWLTGLRRQPRGAGPRISSGPATMPGSPRLRKAIVDQELSRSGREARGHQAGRGHHGRQGRHAR